VYVYKHNHVAVKTKCSQFSRLNETIAIEILQWNLIFFETRKVIRGKMTVFDRGEGNDFWFELSGGSKN